MREARRTAVWITVLAIVAFAGDRVGAFACERILTASLFRFSRIYRGGEKADILIIGDSRGVHSFYAPAIEKRTGRSALNLSYNSMSTPIAEALLADYLDRNQPPRLVIIEPTCVAVDRGLVSELRTYAGLSRRLEALYAREHPRSAVASRLFRLLPYDSEFFLRALLYLRHSDQDWINRNIVAPELMVVPRERWRHRRVPENIAALERIVGMLRAHGIEVRLVVAPYHEASGADVSRLVQDVSRIAPVADYSASVTDRKYFSDTIHMNLDGSEVLLEMLLRDGVIQTSSR